ncbi:hypothetical protein NQZ68_028977 [Dissostichus eleginoides]|nr:hypothetical protein NQZ68_028977 [Dissostichus eleginoides]
MNRECSDGLEDPSSSEEKAILSESGLEQQRRKKAMSRKSQTLLNCRARCDLALLTVSCCAATTRLNVEGPQILHSPPPPRGGGAHGM